MTRRHPFLAFTARRHVSRERAAARAAVYASLLDRDRVTAAIARLHVRDPWGECDGCDAEGDEGRAAWPCRTVRTLAALHGTPMP